MNEVHKPPAAVKRRRTFYFRLIQSGESTREQRRAAGDQARALHVPGYSNSISTTPFIRPCLHTIPERTMWTNPRFTHILVALFTMNSWLAINSVWIEVPAVMQVMPEGWELHSYLNFLLTVANVVLLGMGALQKTISGKFNEENIIFGVNAFNVAAAILLPVLWNYTVVIKGRSHSVPYLIIVFIFSICCCTANVSFMPFMHKFRGIYMRTFFVGQSLAAMVPSSLALAQGVGMGSCTNVSLNGSEYKMEIRYQKENFSVTIYYWVLFCMVFISAIAFIPLASFTSSQHTDSAINKDQKKDEQQSKDIIKKEAGLDTMEEGINPKSISTSWIT
uniref:riboflavin transporter 2-like n=1 Tax=Myxine glutinosa TaxID=7769 RepID=UPI00359005FB